MTLVVFMTLILYASFRGNALFFQLIVSWIAESHTEQQGNVAPQISELCSLKIFIYNKPYMVMPSQPTFTFSNSHRKYKSICLFKDLQGQAVPTTKTQSLNP